MRVVLLDLLVRGLALIAGGLFVVTIWFVFPAFLDVRAGRTAFSDASSNFMLGLVALLGIFGLAVVMTWIDGILRQERRSIGYRKYRSAAPQELPARLPSTQSNYASPPLYPKYQPAYPAYWPELRQLVLERDHHRCGNCGSTEELHVHHIVPLSLGGTNEMGNLRTLCKTCHQKLHPHMQG